MRLIAKHRHHHRVKAPLISISEAEITADLLYPASRLEVRQGAARRTRRGGSR